MRRKRSTGGRDHGCAARLAEVAAVEADALRGRIAEAIVSMELGGAIGADYVRRIAEACADEVEEDVSAAADSERWNDDDVRMAFGRVLARRLGAGEK